MNRRTQLRKSKEDSRASNLNSRNMLRNQKEQQNPPKLKRHQLNHLRHRLNTFVKDNNLANLFGKEDMYLDQKFKEIQVFDEKKELHETLKDLKTKHDILKEQCMKKEKEIQRMQDQIKYIKTEDQELRKEETDLGTQVEDSKNALKEIEIRLEQAHAKKRTYEHILDRMKKDELKHKINSNSVEGQLRLGRKKLSRNIENLIISKREDKETRHALSLVQRRIEEESESRERNLKEMKKTIKKRKLLEKKRLARIKRQKEVAENAATESKDLNEGISDPNDIIKKYIGREEIYGQLLLSIAASEKKLETLKQNYEVILQDKKDLNEELLRLEKPPIDKRRLENEEESEDIKKIKKLTMKLSKLKLEKKTTVQWMTRLFEMLTKSEIVPNSVNYMKYIEQDNLKEGLEMMFGCLRDYYERLDEEEVKQVLIEIVKSGKDLKKAQEKYAQEHSQNSSGIESPPNGSLSSGLNSPSRM